jgi:hypothetical protein
VGAGAVDFAAAHEVQSHAVGEGLGEDAGGQLSQRITLALLGRPEVQVHDFKPEADDPLHESPQCCLVG